jgi:hypothetical protein
MTTSAIRALPEFTTRLSWPVRPARPLSLSTVAEPFKAANFPCHRTLDRNSRSIRGLS